MFLVLLEYSKVRLCSHLLYNLSPLNCLKVVCLQHGKNYGTDLATLILGLDQLTRKDSLFATGFKESNKAIC